MAERQRPHRNGETILDSGESEDNSEYIEMKKFLDRIKFEAALRGWVILCGVGYYNEEENSVDGMIVKERPPELDEELAHLVCFVIHEMMGREKIER